MIRLLGRQAESWDVIRARMMRETERFLEEAMTHPDRQLRIPAIPVGMGHFPRGYADAFWSNVLATS